MKIVTVTVTVTADFVTANRHPAQGSKSEQGG